MYLDDPGHRLYETAMAEHFGNHPLSLSVLGPAESIRNLKRDQMAEYFSRRYGPGNMVVAASGILDFGEFVKQVEKHCGQWPRVSAPREYAQPLYQPKRRTMTDPKLNRAYTMGFTPGPSAQDERRFAARVLSDVIGDSEGSRFYWALVDNAIAEDADFGFYPHDQCGSFYVSVVSDPDRMEQALDIALKELEKVKGDLNGDEVERAKNKIASSLVLSGEVPLGRMRSIGGQWLYNKEYRSLEKDMATLRSITPDSLRQLMADYPFDPLTLVTLTPK
jgi:predicted Zn-dependent peptidase